jgi:hypothetical protein
LENTYTLGPMLFLGTIMNRARGVKEEKFERKRNTEE